MLVTTSFSSESPCDLENETSPGSSGGVRQSFSPVEIRMPFRPRVLLADDHPAFLEAVEAILRPQFEVIGTVGTGTEALAQALSLKPDVIVLDFMMPGLNGIEVIDNLFQAGNGVKAVFLTMHCNEKFVKTCLARGALGHVSKLHLKGHLIPAIRAALAGQTYVSSSFES
jgi:DNA-binding NarL/FixJ family response regulator